MQRSSRSTKQDIVEGWKRNSTSEYYTFLGYSVASNAELEEGYSDITGKYSELMGKKEIMGEKGEIKEVEKLSFYPLDTHLPPIIQLKLRCKEVNFLLDRLQKSLVSKMEKDHNLSQKDCMKQGETQKEKEDKWPRTVLKRIAFCYNFKTFRHLKLIRN